jgi:hypothetical protein
MLYVALKMFKISEPDFIYRLTPYSPHQFADQIVVLDPGRFFHPGVHIHGKRFF